MILSPAQRKRAKGLCAKCGWKSAAYHCDTCHEKALAYQRERQARERRARGAPMRPCGFCEEPGHNVQTCAKLAARRAAAARALAGQRVAAE